jgi:tetratricopeptide (TPR) repeat protein
MARRNRIKKENAPKKIVIVCMIILGFFYFYNSNLKAQVTTKDVAQRVKKSKAIESLADAYFADRLYEKAIDKYREALMLEPKNAKAHYFIGCSYGRLGDLNNAMLAFEKTIEIDPDFHRALNNLADIYVRKGELERALKLIQKALLLAPQQTGYSLTCSEIYMNMGKYDLALAMLEKIVDDPKNGQTAKEYIERIKKLSKK